MLGGKKKHLKMIAAAKPFTNINIGFLVICVLMFYNKTLFLFILHDKTQLLGTFCI